MVRIVAAVSALAVLTVAAPGLAQDYDVPTKPKAVKLKAKKVGKRRYKVRATVVLKASQTKADCAGGKAKFTARPGGKLTTTFDAKCHADITVKANPGTKLKVRFGGTDALLPKSSRTIRLRK
ncbi:MAG: hypothetical protein QOH58_1259 [Thermoleophilaceae bacterium]|jgi:hypothetical protein|nr:hypothetical protein [Thermoleophilaceae bacterium]